MAKVVYSSYQYSYPKQNRSWRLRLLLIIVAIGGLLTGFFWYTSPSASATLVPLTTGRSSQPKLPWPAYGQSAVGAQDYGVLAVNHPKATPVPTASVIKVLTALAVLKKHPLEPGQAGPAITITAEDVASFNDYTLRDGAVVKVEVGQEVSEYQALQAMLIKSANNMADTLVRWSYGSMGEYLTVANQYAKELGLENTHVADASGFSPQTVSTAEDLVKLGEVALANPVLAEIVSTWQTDIPNIGQVTNSNVFLDFEGNQVIGIKTGHTDEAGGVYLVAARYLVEGREITVVSAVMGAPSHFSAQQDTMPLIQATRDGFYLTEAITQGKAIGTYSLRWGGEAVAQAEDSLQVLAWGNQSVRPQVELKNLRPLPLYSPSKAGEVVVNEGAAHLVSNATLAEPLPKPSLWWRIKYLLHLQ